MMVLRRSVDMSSSVDRFALYKTGNTLSVTQSLDVMWTSFTKDFIFIGQHCSFISGSIIVVSLKKREDGSLSQKGVKDIYEDVLAGLHFH